MDFIATDIFSSPSTFSVDESPRPVRTARPSSSSGLQKRFSAVLQRARVEEGRADRREADDIRPSNKSSNKPQVNEAKGRDGSSARTERADASPSKTSERDRSDENMNKSAQASRKDVTRKDDERSTVDDARSDSPGPETQSVPAPVPVPITTHTINQEQIPTEENPRSSTDEHRATTASSVSTLISPAPSIPSMATAETYKDASSSDGAATQSNDRPKQTSGTPARPMEKNDPQASPSLKQDPQTGVDGVDTKPIVADVEGHAASLEQKTGQSRPQADALPGKDSSLNSGQVPKDGGMDRPMNDPDQIVKETAFARSVSAQFEGHKPSHGDKGHVESKTEVLLSVEDPAQSVGDDGAGESKLSATLLRGPHSSFDVMKHFSELKAGRNGSLHDQAQIELPQPAAVEHHVSGGQSTASIMPGAQGVAGSGSPPPPPTPFVSHAQPAMPGHDPADKSAQMTARSVVFDVAQPDLGHVNVRVAMMNDVVHTHLSADRPEVGQFLINGQDRLQAAFQANGLDMGQFRVDIDRQGFGRSFHHGSYQEQGQSWNQDSQGMKWGQSPDRQDEQRSSLHGLLNLVA